MGKKQTKVESLIELISDTHGLVRPEALDALRGDQRKLHLPPLVYWLHRFISLGN
jgi:hypothetical protein